MSSFLPGVETEEDFLNTMQDGIDAISKTPEPQSPTPEPQSPTPKPQSPTPKPQSPSKKRGLEDDCSQPAESSPDHRPKKQYKRSSSDSSPDHRRKKKAVSRVRSNDGQLEWLDEADVEWKPADYHWKYRAQLLELCAQQPGATPWKPALGTNWTSYSPLIQGWTEDPDTVLDSKGRRVFDMENAPIDWNDDPPYAHLTYNGLIMLDYENRPIKDIPGLPLTLAEGSKGWLLEGLRRCTKIEVNDFIARYPFKVGYSTLVQAMSRWTKTIRIRTWKTHSKEIKKIDPAITLSDSEGSTIPASPIIPQTQSGSLDVGFCGQEWPPSSESLSQSTHALDAAYSENGSCHSAVGNSAPSPWDAESSVKYAVHSSHPMVQQIQLGKLNDGFSPQERPPMRETSSQTTCAYGTAYPRAHPYYSTVGDSVPSPWDAVSSANPRTSVLRSGQCNRHRGGHYSYAPEISYYDQKNTKSIVRRVINEQRKQAGIRANETSIMPQTASVQPLCSIRLVSRGSFFSDGDFYHSPPTNIDEGSFIWSMLEYTRSHFRTLMSREPPVTTFCATYIRQYNQLQAHLDRMWPYPGIPPELRSVAPVAGWSAWGQN